MMITMIIMSRITIRAINSIFKSNPEDWSVWTIVGFAGCALSETVLLD